MRKRLNAGAGALGMKEWAGRKYKGHPVIGISEGYDGWYFNISEQYTKGTAIVATARGTTGPFRTKREAIAEAKRRIGTPGYETYGDWRKAKVHVSRMNPARRVSKTGWLKAKAVRIVKQKGRTIVQVKQ